MVRNEDVKQEFDMFAAVWKAFKSLLPVGTKDDIDYWNNATEQTTAIMQKYPDPFSKDIALAVLTELERRSKANENQSPGR